MRHELLCVLSNEQLAILKEYNLLESLEKLIFEENLINCEYPDYATIFRNSKIVGMSVVKDKLAIKPVFFDGKEFDCVMMIMRVPQNITFKEISDILYDVRDKYNDPNICYGAYYDNDISLTCIFVKY